MILIDASMRWWYVCLLSSCNLEFARLLAQVIWLRAQFPNNPIKIICLVCAGEFTSQAFNAYYMASDLNVEHPIAYVHMHNKLLESFIKCLQLVVRPLLMRTNLSNFSWLHLVLHFATLIYIRSTSCSYFSPYN